MPVNLSKFVWIISLVPILQLPWRRWSSPEENGKTGQANLPPKLHMMTSSNGNIFRVTGPLCGEFTGPGEFPTQRPVTRSFDVFFDLRPNKRLSKQWRGWWFETLSCPFWRHRNEENRVHILWDILCVPTCIPYDEFHAYVYYIRLQERNQHVLKIILT